MPAKNFLLFSWAFIFSMAACAQSVYHFKYNFKQAKDSVSYHAMLVRYDDGTGLLRLRYQTGTEDVVREADVIEQFSEANANATDTQDVVYKTVNPRLITGNAATAFTLPAFLFTYNSNSGFIEPTAALPADFKNIKEDAAPQFFAELINNSALTQKFVLQFFSEDEDFFINLFKNNTRGLSAAEKDTRLFLLAVTNTNEKIIGSSCMLDKQRILQTFTELTGSLGIRMITDTVSGNNYSKKNVEIALKKLKPSPNDIVIFYYSGHGFSKPGSKNRFPFIDLRAKPADDYKIESMGMEDIFTAIKKKGARCNLVLSDCCNTEVTKTNAIGSKPLKTKGSGVKWSEDNIRNLFLSSTPISIIATAADTTQKSAGNPVFGGFFSYFFKTSMENYCSILKTNPSWDQVLQATKLQTINKATHTYCDKPYIPENICRQSPVYKVALGR